MTERFTGSFTQQEPIPEAAIEAALTVMRHGRLHRYNTVGDDPGEVALLEQESRHLLVPLSHGQSNRQAHQRGDGEVHLQSPGS